MGKTWSIQNYLNLRATDEHKDREDWWNIIRTREEWEQNFWRIFKYESSHNDKYWIAL